VRIGFCHKGVVGFPTSDISAEGIPVMQRLLFPGSRDLIPDYVEKIPGSAK
jgi:hypothetical protein